MGYPHSICEAKYHSSHIAPPFHCLLPYVTELEHIEFSAEQQEVFSEFNVSYVLTGYIRKIHSGLMLSIKIVELKSGKLVAFSNKVLPNVVINSVL